MPSTRPTPSIAPRPSAVDPAAAAASSPTGDTKSLNPRILKKREADRKCQRIIRERTKSKIAYLEDMVDEFKRKDTSGQVETLMKQLAEARQERESFAKKLKNIETVLTEGRLLFRDGELVKDGSPDSVSSRPTALPSVKHSVDNDLHTLVNKEKLESCNESLDHNILSEISPHHRDSVSLPDISPFTAPQSTESLFDVDTSSNPIPTHIGAIDTTYAQPQQPCECSMAMQPMNRKPTFNIWRYANDVLSSRFRWPAHFNMLEDEFGDDVPVRVVLEGWDAVERRGDLHPSWHILKRIDQAIFWRCEPRERLAVLYAMHALFESHSNTNPQRSVDLPSFFSKGPSDPSPNSYAINYFTWPGIRGKFFENQHKYCTNDFWTIFTRNLRVLWPFELRDCYTRNIETGLYSISPTFRNRVSDLRTWTMGPELFQRWPEFRTDIPCFNSIPGSVSNNPTNGGSRALSMVRKSAKPPHRTSIVQENMGMSNDQTPHTITEMPEGLTMQQVVSGSYDSVLWPQLHPPASFDVFNFAPNISTTMESYIPPYA